VRAAVVHGDQRPAASSGAGYEPVEGEGLRCCDHTNRAVGEVAKDYGIAWWTVHRLLVRAAAGVLGQAAPTTMIGIDETHDRSVRWIQDGVEQAVTWRRSDPWLATHRHLVPGVW
jgi:hypothetical protein